MATKQKILIVDDDENIAELISLYLTKECYETKIVGDGEEALKVATTIKLTRALWIIPLALVTSFIFKSKGQKISIPWFIFFFVLAMIFNTYVLGTTETGAMIGEGINSLARKTLTITLFFIGASLSRDVLKAVGIKPLIQGTLLWIVISVSTLAYIYLF